VIVFNIALQTFESYLITPIVQRYTVTLPPVVTIFAQLLMGVFIGAIGIIMAAPLATAVMVIMQMLYVDDHLGDSDAGRFT
jgi:predicted PurR-regulated permease PerM